MDFSVTQRFRCSPETYWSRSRGPEFDAAIASAAAVHAQMLESKVEGSKLFERILVTHIEPMTTVAQKAFGATHLKYTQEIETTDATHSTKWKIIPSFFTDRVTCKGDSVVRATPTGCERVIKGSIEVRVMLVGGVIEKQIADQISRSYTAAEQLIRKFVEA